MNLPSGFRFHPTDEELVEHYLCRKCTGQNISAQVIAEIDIYKFDPWDLPGMSCYGEKEWYFFSPRDRKYPNGSRPNRAAGNGFWKATGVDKPVGRPNTLAIKKALVFYAGKAPKGVKTNWIMHEYRLANVDRSANGGKRNKLRLDEWVLCRIYNKKGAMERHDVSGSEEEEKPTLISTPPLRKIPTKDYIYIDTPEYNMKSSSSSENTSSPEFHSDEEDKLVDFDFLMNFDDCFKERHNCCSSNNGFYAETELDDDLQLSLFQEMFAYMQKSL